MEILGSALFGVFVLAAILLAWLVIILGEIRDLRQDLENEKKPNSGRKANTLFPDMDD